MIAVPAISGAARALVRALERYRQRRYLLAMLDQPDFLHDVGLSRAEALHEAHKPSWRR